MPDGFESTAQLIRNRAIGDRKQQITTTPEVYHHLLSEFSWAIQNIRQLGELGGGLFPPSEQSPIASEREARLRDIARKIATHQ